MPSASCSSTSSTEHGLLTSSRAKRHLRRCHPHPPRRHARQREAHPADGPSRYRVPKGEAARRPFRIEDGRAYGPGVSDMKGGLVINAFVLAAFKRFGGAPAPLAGLITSDEEIASPSSRPVIERVARAGPLRLQLRTRPALRQRRHRAQGRRVPHVRGVRQGGAFRRQLREGHQRDRRTGAQGRRHAQADRPDARHDGERRHRSAAGNRSTPRRRTRKARSTCATSSPKIAP